MNTVCTSSEDVGAHKQNFSYVAEGDKILLKGISEEFVGNKMYIVISVIQKKMEFVSKADFTRRDLPVIEKNNMVFKYKGSRAEAQKFIHSYLSYKGESNYFNDDLNAEFLVTDEFKDKITSITGKFKDFISGVQTIFNAVSSVGRGSTYMSEKIAELRGGATVVYGKMKYYSKVVVSLLKMLTKVWDYTTTGALKDLLGLVLELYTLYTEYTGYFKGESMDTLVIAGVSMVLPQAIVSILKQLNVLTNKKIFDDVNIFLEFFSLISSVLDYIINMLPNKVQDFIKPFMALLGLKEYVLISKIRSLIERKVRDTKSILDDNYRSEVRKVYDSIKKIDMPRFLAQNKPLSSMMDHFIRIHKGVVSYENISRIEPSCFIFEGKPGCRKSTTVNALIKVLGKTHYSHITKPIEDTKDWFDSYDNEEIMYMDDVGQMGISQWRSIINWVSNVKLPLDCADAKLKDTKFFNSSIIFATTNRFMQLNGFTSKDCISHPEALWRRGYVFDMNEVVANGSGTTGVCRFRYYDLKAKMFVNGFPPEFVDFLLENKVDITASCNTANQSVFLYWLSVIVMGFNKMRSMQQKDNDISNDKIQFIRKINPFLEDDAPEHEIFLDAVTDIAFNIEPSLLMSMESGWTDVNSTSGIFEYIMSHAEASINYISVMLSHLYDSVWDSASKLISIFSGNHEVLNDADELFIQACSLGVMMLFIALLESAVNMQPEGLLSVGSDLASSAMGVGSSVKDAVVGVASKAKNWFIPNKIPPPTVDSYEDYVDTFTSANKYHSSIDKLKKSVHLFNAHFTGGLTAVSHCVWSGKYIIAPGHTIKEDIFQLTVFKSGSRNHREIDHMVVKVVFRDYEDDVVVVALDKGYPSPKPNLINSFDVGNSGLPKYLIFPEKVVEAPMIRSNGKSPLRYSVKDGMNEIKNWVEYNNIRFAGMCGVPVVTDRGKIAGIHVAGDEKSNKGVSVLWKNSTLAQIKLIVASNQGLTMDVEESDKIYDNFSATKVITGIQHTTPKKTNFVESPIHGVFPISRIPANLSVYGDHTVKDLAKASMTPIKSVDMNALNFGKKLLDLYIDDFIDIDESVVIKGDDVLSRMNPKSSNGHFPIKNKTDCFNYDTGEYTPAFRVLYDEFKTRMISGSILPSDVVWTETLKDELRAIEKKEPRSFRICPVTMQVATKSCFGNMAKQLYNDRWFNEIMIGINPFTDWNRLYAGLNNDRIWAADVKRYDKQMLVQVQQAVCDVILSHYKGNNPVLAENVLRNIPFSLVVANNISFITTHSLPSGSWLTALFNSLVNRMYTGMWYYDSLSKNGLKPDVLNFTSDVYDPVYGDDRMNSCKNLKLVNYLNAITMSDFFESLGMELTTSTKGKITEPFQTLKDITFLKRTFEYHYKLGKIVCPLELGTLFSSLSFLDSSKEDLEGILSEKINNFQREVFLHEERREELLNILERKCVEKGILFSRLPDKYLIELYNKGKYDETYNSKFGIFSF